MWILVIISVSLFSATYSGVSPIYSESYSNVYYQGPNKHNSGYGGREEVTEAPAGFDEVNPTLGTDTATEPNSESVNITKMFWNQRPKKLHERIELEEEIDTTQQPDLEPSDPPVSEKQGIYYIYHPNGLLQRVVFTTQDNLQKMEYFANVNYQNVEPVVEPIYTYDPNTLVFQRLDFNYL